MPNSEGERIKAHEDKISWQTRSRKTHAEEFLARSNAARPQLGVALRSLWEWAVRAWMSASRWSNLLSNRTSRNGDGHCSVRLRTWGRNIFPPATLLSPYSSSKYESNCAQRRGKSNRKSGDTYQSRDTTCSEGPKGPHFLTHTANANNLKCSNHSTRSSKRKLTELLKPFSDDTTSSQRPNGLIEDTKLKHIYIIEIARTDDSPDSLLRAYVKKTCTYNSLLHALRKAFPQYVVKKQNYDIGILGSINEQQWRQQLTELGMNSHQQDKTIQKCIAASIRGTHAVASSSEKQDNGWSRNAKTRSGNVYIHIYTIYSMLHITHVNTHTHTPTLLSLLD